MPRRHSHTSPLDLRVRIYCAGEIAVGPGKADLLVAIAETGSLVRAARKLDMSYMRAWTLLRTMNRCFAKPLAIARRGGRKGGRAELTDEGTRVLAMYQQMIAASRAAAEPIARPLIRRLKRKGGLR